MRFLRLDLLAFGPFADAPPLDLSGGDRGLHLIVGRNEAGKSSTLRALRGLLFGFPRSMADNHRHAYADIRVGATVRDEAGNTLQFLRRKKDIQSLRDGDDARALPDDALRPFLGDLDARRFDDLFALDHAELVAGGRAILDGGGQLGSILFAAGTGLARLDQVRAGLDAEMASLFLERGKNPAINKGLTEWLDARARREQQTVPTPRWVECEGERDQAETARDAVDREFRRLDAERRRLERLRDALPTLALRHQAASAVADHAAVPILADGFSDRRRTAAADLESGLRARAEADAALAALDAELAEIGPPDPALAEPDAIRALRDRAALDRRAQADRPAEVDRLDRAEAEVAALRSAIGLPADPGPVSEADRQRIESLIRDLGRIEARVDQVASVLGDTLNFGDDDPDQVAALADAAARAQQAGDLEDQLRTAKAELADAEAQAAADLRALELWSGTLADLEALACPSPATLDLWERRIDDADAALGCAHGECDRARAELAALDREAGSPSDPGRTAVPTEAELAAFRADRDRGWRDVRVAWGNGEPAVAPGALDLAAAYESGVRRADDHADRLRREADRIAEQAQRDARRRDLNARLDDRTAEADRHRADRDALAAEWVRLWAPLGIEPRSPREMKDWANRARADLVRQARAIRTLRGRVEARREAIAGLRGELARGLVALGWPDPGPDASLPEVVRRARAAVARAEAQADGRAAAVELAAWRDRWADAVAPLGLGRDCTPARALAVARHAGDLADRLREAAAARDRIAESDRLSNRFAADAADLAARVAPDLGGRPPAELAAALIDRLDRAGLAEARRADRLRLRDREQLRRDGADAQVRQAEGVLNALCREAGVEEPDRLPEVERASAEAARRRDRLHDLDAQLARLAGPGGVAALIAEAGTAEDEGPLDARIADLSGRIAPLEAKRERLGVELGRALARLEQIDGGPAAADAEQEVETRLARLSIDVARYVRLRLASAALQEAIARHREKHQWAVLARAGDLFAALTGGSFAGLRAEVGDGGEPILLGVRGDARGTRVAVAGMSEGTADQLYLALRLAALGAHLDHHDPMPLIVDDLLVNFDNARATAALGVLADLSRRTQILFFTHHDHLADLARAAVPPGDLFVHRIDHALSVPRDESAEPAPARTRRKAAAREA